MENELLAGKVVTTHGIKGEIKAIYYTDSADFFDGIKHIRLSESTYELEGVRAHKGAVLIKLRGVDSVEDGERLIGKDIYVSRDEATLPSGKFYIVDIIGLDVVSEENEKIGTVVDVFSTGSNDVFEVKTADGNMKYIPNISDIVKKIDIPNKTVTIHIMEGLLDDED